MGESLTNKVRFGPNKHNCLPYRLLWQRLRTREMESATDAQGALNLNPSNVRPENVEEKPKLVVVMGPTGSGKSRLAIDLASHFPIEIINADSMQVYQGLDVLTNKVPLHEQKGLSSLSLSLSLSLFYALPRYVCVKFTFE
jgi:hypothetical protein